MAITYEVKLAPSAAKTLAKIDPAVRRRIVRAFQELAVSARPPGVKRLRGFDNQWRIRVGDWRIVYAIEDAQLLVLVLRIGHRSSVYD